MDLVERIKQKKIIAGVIGLGYVGLPLAVEFASSGLKVIGFDVDKAKVKKVNKGISYIKDVSSERLKELVMRGKLEATFDFSLLKKCDTVNICVPTPLRKTKDPDISYIVSAVKELVKYVHKNMLIILESTTYPGTTEEIVQEIIETHTNLKAGKDFYLAFSPERVDPGNKKFNTKNTPKVVGGLTKKCSLVAKTLYEQAIEKVVLVSSPKAAEMVKLLENTFRAVNIGLVNELAKMCKRFDVDVWEVIDAAATKPFGFMPFYPGPGLGGHCIPIDPFYLSWKAKALNFNARFIELAGEVNTSMPEYVVELLQDALNEKKKSVKGSKILILGVAYKPDIDDVRESPAIDIIKLLYKKGAKVKYNDPYIPVFKIKKERYKSIKLSASILKSFDAVVIATNHTIYDYDFILKNSKLIIDTRNAYKNVKSKKIIKL